MALEMEGTVPSTALSMLVAGTTTKRQRRRPTKSLRIQLWFDGGSRGNPGIAGAGAHLVITMITSIPPKLVDSTLQLQLLNDNTKTSTNCIALNSIDGDIVIVDKKLKVVDVRYYCGKYYTNNYAEYCGIREGLLEAKRHVDEFCRSATVGTTDSKQNIGLGSELPPTSTTDTNADVVDTSDCSNDNNSDWNYQIEVDIKGDSNMIIEQLNGNYACRNPTLKILFQECIGLIRGIQDKAEMTTTTMNEKRKRSITTSATIDDDDDRISVVVHQQHVYRDKNKVADALANEAMDKKKSWKTHEGDSELLKSSNISVEMV